MSLPGESLSSRLSAVGLASDTPAHCDLEFQPELYRLLNLRTAEGCRNMEQIGRLLSRRGSKPKPFMQLKLVMLVHHLVLKFKDCRTWVRENPVDLGGWAGGADSGRQVTGADKVAHFAAAYYRMLQKYCFSEDIYDFSLRRARETSPSGAIEKTYLLMNLIRESSPLLRDVIYFGRYHRAEYLIVTDVLRVVTRQLALLYESMFGCVYTLMRGARTLGDGEVEQTLTILEEVPSVNEVVVTYFYNRYYYDEGVSPGIEVLHTDSLLYRRAVEELELRRKQRRRAKLDSFQLSDFESTYFSLVGRQEQTADL